MSEKNSCGCGKKNDSNGQVEQFDAEGGAQVQSSPHEAAQVQAAVEAAVEENRHGCGCGGQGHGHGNGHGHRHGGCGCGGRGKRHGQRSEATPQDAPDDISEGRPQLGLRSE